MAGSTSIGIAADYPITLRGGVGVIVESLIQNLSSRYRLTLISPDRSPEFISHACQQRLDGHIYVDHDHLSREGARQLAREIQQRALKLVHFNGGGHLTWGNRRGLKSPMPFLRDGGVPCIYSAHQICGLLEGYCRADRPLWYKLALLPAMWSASTYALAHANRIIADSRHDARLLGRNYPWLAHKIDFIYHSRLDQNEPAAPRAEREHTVLSVGHIAFRKGQHVLADAFAQIAPRHPDWKLVMAGPVLETACGEAIEQTRSKHRLHDRILTIGSHPQPDQLMRTAAIFVQPSLIEAFGLALQEAMFRECACIGTRTGGIPELITHEQTGLLCAVNNPSELAQALERLLLTPMMRDQLGQAARLDIVRRGMTGRAMAQQYEALYRRLLPGGN
jgi:glycosyltransferase involved in cell wall biosynthesis